MSTTQQVTTENGAVSLATSGSARVDLFTKTVRGIDTERLDALLEASWAEDALHTLKILFYCRDCRGGKGERKIFYDGMRFVLRKDKNIFLKNMKLIGSMYGRWSDLLQFIDEEQVATEIAQLFADQLKQDWSDMQQGKPITLCAKWAPTENCSIDNKKHAVKKICAALEVDKKTYRKQYLVPLRAYLKVIETYMCAKEWSKIDYSKVPGVAMNKLKKAFEKNDKERFDEYRAKLQKGDKTVKVNAATVEAHELVSQYMRGTQEDAIVEAQWKEIVKRVEEMGSLSNSIVLSDVSGSMEGTPMQVSIALGLIISEVTRPPFQNLVITFHENPTMHRVVGKTLKERVTNLQAAPWGGSTNLQSAFDLILEQAKNANLSPDEMPTRLYIISDMQFNQADRNFTTNHETIKLKYRQAGYEMPQIVYWNVRANTNDVAAKSNEAGVALLGGFSTAMLKSVLNGKDFSPFAVMLQAIENERYSAVSI